MICQKFTAENFVAGICTTDEDLRARLNELTSGKGATGSKIPRPFMFQFRRFSTGTKEDGRPKRRKR